MTITLIIILLCAIIAVQRYELWRTDDSRMDAAADAAMWKQAYYRQLHRTVAKRRLWK